VINRCLAIDFEHVFHAVLHYVTSLQKVILHDSVAKPLRRGGIVNSLLQISCWVQK